MRSRGARVVALLAAALVAGGGLSACSSDTEAVTNVDAASAVEILADPEITVVDVRTPAEFDSGHLADAVNIDIEGTAFEQQLTDLPPSDTYLVYCHSGNRSRVATDKMASLGFTKVYNLEGGITGWQASGGAIVAS